MINSYRMSKSAKIAFSLDERLLDRVERMRARTGESRSALIARALAAVTEDDVRGADVRRYVEAYRDHPETADDEAAARKSARRTLKRLPWDDS
jgi:metal-responsive CopG/Arc/MetJ family transcriptional regulator